MVRARGSCLRGAVRCCYARAARSSAQTWNSRSSRADFAPGSAWDAYGQFPFVAGYSAAAEVAGLGEGVEGLAIGDLVAAGTPHARWSTASASAVYPLRGAVVPVDHMPFVTLAATVMNGVRRGQVPWGAPSSSSVSACS